MKHDTCRFEECHQSASGCLRLVPWSCRADQRERLCTTSSFGPSFRSVVKIPDKYVPVIHIAADQRGCLTAAPLDRSDIRFLDSALNELPVQPNETQANDVFVINLTWNLDEVASINETETIPEVIVKTADRGISVRSNLVACWAKANLWWS